MNTVADIWFIIEKIKAGGKHSIVFHPRSTEEINEFLKIIKDEFKDWFNCETIMKRYLEDSDNKILYSLEFEKECITRMDYTLGSLNQLQECQDFDRNNTPNYEKWFPIFVRKERYSDIWSET